ncbi:RICIN domain-containing protein [Actinoplanes aureus]|uniref:RICIN domain-containing protein n=1 Tax=Actinoplanes aureus TaxID=2792083 RepID=A0A931G1K8_9ACTN|nr:RICIN domain-containing protein [Actinoplanes aureus]MBG0568018.1 RICIN domain-containing protein [Actinoplanes aureus]
MLGTAFQFKNVARRRWGIVLVASLVTILSFGSVSRADATSAQQVSAAESNALAGPAVPPTQWVYIRSFVSDLNLGVSGSSPNNGAPIIQWKREGKQDQAWKFIKPTSSSTSSYIVNAGTSSWKAMGVSGGSKANGGKIIQWDYLGVADQIWRLEEVGTNSYQKIYYRLVNLNSDKCLAVPNGATTPVQAIQWDCSYNRPDQWWFLPPWPAS